MVDSFPKIAREAISRLRLPVDFTKAESVQLGDFLKDSEASYWGDWTLRGFGDPKAAPPAAPRPPQARPIWPWIVPRS